MNVIYLMTQRNIEYITGDNCERIEEHPARGNGDKWFYDIYRTGEIVVRIFDPAEVRWLENS